MITLNRTYLNRTIPFDWIITSIRNGSTGYRHLLSMLIVRESVHIHNGQRWLHVTISHSARVPTWQEIRRVKSIWIGDNRTAYHVLPRRVRLAEDREDAYTFHLWCPLDNNPFPAEMRGAA